MPVILVLFGALIGATVLGWLCARNQSAVTKTARPTAPPKWPLSMNGWQQKIVNLKSCKRLLIKRRLTWRGPKTRLQPCAPNSPPSNAGRSEREESFKQATTELAEKFKALSRDALKRQQSGVSQPRSRDSRNNFKPRPRAISNNRQQAIDQLVKAAQGIAGKG